VKRSSADGSVGFPHVRVGHRQAPIRLIMSSRKPDSKESGFFTFLENQKTAALLPTIPENPVSRHNKPLESGLLAIFAILKLGVDKPDKSPDLPFYL
ncbi:hypothetical protein K6Y31_21440, partial [Motilimonas cestriensis]|nr:hypothetical protein [Motilimonas cestriensis]